MMINKIRKRKNNFPCTLPQVCIFKNDGEDKKYAIREVKFNKEGIISEISKYALSPKCSTSDELKSILEALVSKHNGQQIVCGEDNVSRNTSEIVEWISLIGFPVIDISV